MSLRIGLYYPYTRVRNKNWLRLAALYWPKIARVKPVDWDVQSSELEEQLQDELDLFVEVSQEQAHLDTLAKITALLHDHGDEIRDRYRVNASAITEIYGFAEGSVLRDGHCFSNAPGARLVTSPWPLPTFGNHTERPQNGLVVIYLRDYTLPLAKELADQGLALVDDKNRIIAVPPNLAWAYSGLLSDKLAELNRLVPITDEDAVYASMSEWDTRLAAQRLLGHTNASADWSRLTFETAIGMLAVEQVVPKDISNVPTGKLIEIRRRYGAQFDAFHDLVYEISAEIPVALEGVNDRAVVEAYLKNVVRRRIESPRMELERAVRSLGIDTTLSTTAVKVELLTMIGISVGIPVAAGEPIFATAGAAFAAYSFRRERVKQRESMVRTAPVGYLWEINRKLKPKPLLQKILKR